jgi:hypothetical protein
MKTAPRKDLAMRREISLVCAIAVFCASAAFIIYELAYGTTYKVAAGAAILLGISWIWFWEVWRKPSA